MICVHRSASIWSRRRWAAFASLCSQHSPSKDSRTLSFITLCKMASRYARPATIGLKNLLSHWRTCMNRRLLTRSSGASSNYILYPSQLLGHSFAIWPSPLTLDSWSYPNLKRINVVTAHWVDVVTLKTKRILLTIMYVKCGAGVGTNLFKYLKLLAHDVVTRVLNVTSDNGWDATSAIVRLFQLVNVFVNYEKLCKCNHIQCVDHFVQLAELQILKLIR